MTKKIFENYFQQNLKEVRYTIRRGDTLSRIARKFGLDSWRDIMRVNRKTIRNPNRIRAGQVINIPGRFSPGPDKTREKNPGAYLRRKTKLPKFSTNRVLSKAKQYSGFNSFLAKARKAGWSLKAQWSTTLETDVFGVISGKQASKTAIIYLNLDEFTKVGMIPIQDALNELQQIAKDEGQEFTYREFKQIVNFKEEFCARWASITLSHELEHALHMFKGQKYLDKLDGKNISDHGQGESENRARQREAAAMREQNKPINNSIYKLLNMLNIRLNLTTDEQYRIVLKLMDIWNDAKRETMNFFMTADHIDFDRADPVTQSLLKISGPDTGEREVEREAEFYELIQNASKMGSNALKKLKNYFLNLRKSSGGGLPVGDATGIKGVQENSQGENIKMKNINESQNEKIFNNYFKQNLKENAEISTSDPAASDIADIVVDEINAVFEDLPDDSPLKNREVALAALAKIKAGLPAMIQGLNVS